MTKKEQILKLRSEGKTYREIQIITGCSNGTIGYYCSNYQVNRIRSKIKDFKRGSDADWSYDDFVNKFKHVKQCYLTGRPIDISDPDSFCLDHIVPRFLGGTSNLDNVGLTVPDANFSKHAMSVEQYIKLCKDVVDTWEKQIK